MSGEALLILIILTIGWIIIVIFLFTHDYKDRNLDRPIVNDSETDNPNASYSNFEPKKQIVEGNSGKNYRR